MGRQCVKFSSLWNPRQVPFKLKLVSFGRSPSPRLSHPLLSFGTRSYKSREHEPDSSRIKCCDKDASLGILLKFETWHIVNAFSRSIERLCTQSYKVQMQNQQTNTRSQITRSNKYFVTRNTFKIKLCSLREIPARCVPVIQIHLFCNKRHEILQLCLLQ